MELCEVCRVNTATIHLTQIEQGEAVSRHLCNDCAQEEGIPVADEMNGNGENESEEIPPLACPRCETTEDQLASSGEVGCSECYKVFQEFLAERSGYRGSFRRYDGKQYRQSGSRNFQSELDTLRRELGAAISEERFEVASVLRDRIREIEANEEISWS